MILNLLINCLKQLWSREYKKHEFPKVMYPFISHSKTEWGHQSWNAVKLPNLWKRETIQLIKTQNLEKIFIKRSLEYQNYHYLAVAFLIDRSDLIYIENACIISFVCFPMKRIWIQQICNY